MDSGKKDELVLAKLDEIESEMKRIHFWSAEPSELQVAHYTEAPTFELWLQCVFIPNARTAAAKGEYPAKSQVGMMAMRQYDYHDYIEEAQGLLQLLMEFDKIIESRPKPGNGE